MGLLGQVVAAAVLVAALVGYGVRPARRVTRALALPLPTALALVPAIGIAALGCGALALGALGALGPWSTLILAAPAVALLAGDAQLRADARMLVARAREHARRHPIVMTALGVAALMMLAATLAPPAATDEVEYHWPAALDWARSGTFGDSPYRHVDGFAFMEVVYTLAASLRSSTAAHVLHLVTFFMLAAATAGVARSNGLRDTFYVGAAVLALPVAANQSYLAYNDIAAGAYAVLAVAILAANVLSLRHLAAAAAAIAVGTSIKPNVAGTAGVLALLILLAPALLGRARLSWRETGIRWLILGSVTGAVLAAWSLRRFVLTGDLFDPTLAGPQSFDALSRQADVVDKILLPIMPLALGVIGALEPWGGRIGVVLAVALPVALVLAARRCDGWRTFVVLAIPAYAHWLAVGYAGPPRTRLHLVVWCLFLVASWAILRAHPRRRLVVVGWGALVLLCLADNAFEMTRAIDRITTTVGGPSAAVAIAGAVLLTLGACVVAWPSVIAGRRHSRRRGEAPAGAR